MMRRLWIVPALAVLATAAALAAEGTMSRAELAKLIERLPEYAAYEHFETALAELKKAGTAAELDRKGKFELIFGLTQLQSSMLKANELEMAVLVARKAQSLFPGEAAVNLDLGGLLVAKGDYKEAIPVLRRALTLGRGIRTVEKVDKVAGYLNLGKALLLTKQAKAAKSELFKAAALGEKTAAALYLLGQACVQLEEDQAALLNLERAFKMDRREAQPQDLINLADLLADSGKYDKVAEVCAYGVKRFPVEEGLHYYWALCLLRQDKRVDAFYMLQHERALRGSNSVYTVATGRKIYEITEQVLKSPKEPQHRQIAICVLGMQNCEPGKYERAVHFFKMGIAESKQKNPMLHLFLGEAYGRLKNYTEAVRELETAVVIDPYLAPAYVELGDMLLKDGRPQAAIVAWRKAVLLAPDNWKVKRLIARAKKEQILSGAGGAADDFQAFLAREHPVRVSRITPGNSSITSPGGGQMLQFTDAPGLANPEHPEMYYEANFAAGTMGFSCDFRNSKEAPARFRIEMRHDRADAVCAGPSFIVDVSGRCFAGGEYLTTVPLGEWVHLEIIFSLGANAAKTCTVRLTAPGKKAQTFTAQYRSKAFEALTWLGLSSLSDARAVFEMNNVKLVKVKK